MLKSEKQKGFSLIEIVIAVVITGIIAAASSNLLIQGFQFFTATKNSINANWQSVITLENMTRYLRSIRSPSDIVSAGSNNITFYDTIGNTINYTLSGSTLMLNSQPLADNMQNLIFVYYDKDGVIINTPNLNLPSIRYITINLGQYQNQLIATVYPWNLI